MTRDEALVRLAEVNAQIEATPHWGAVLTELNEERRHLINFLGITEKKNDVLLRPLVIIESPFAGNQDRNLQYLRLCLRHSWGMGELPFASHAYFPFFLRESLPEERQAGIEAGYHFWKEATHIIFYTDLGMSPGMITAAKRCVQHEREPVFRHLKGSWLDHLVAPLLPSTPKEPSNAQVDPS